MSESALPKHKTPVKAVVKRIGGGYSMKPAAECPRLSPLGVKHTKPVCAPLHMDFGLSKRHVNRAVGGKATGSWICQAEQQKSLPYASCTGFETFPGEVQQAGSPEGW